MKYYFMSLMLFVFGLHHAQNCNFTLLGEVKDFHDGTPITAANIYIKQLDKYIISDFDGKFKIEDLCKGEITLVISHIGCETKTTTIDISGDAFKSIALEHHIEELNEVAVKGSAYRNTTKTAQETVLKTSTIEQYSHLSLGDALKEVSGVSSINTGNSIVKPMINGLHSSRLLILNNDVRLQDQEWGIEHAPNIDINSANQISVIKGSGALAYGGDAIGGVVVIKPSRIIRKDSLYGKTIIGGQTNGRGYNLTSSLHKSYKSGWFANVQGSLKQNGDFKAPDYNLTNTGLQSQSFSVQAGKNKFESGFELFYSYIHSEIAILSASHIGNVNDLINAINSKEPTIIRDFSYDIDNPKQEITHHLLKGKYFKRFKNFGKLSLQYDYQNNRRLEFDIRRGELNNEAALDLTLQTHTLLADVNLDANLNHKVNFGILTRYQDNYAPNTGVRRLIPNYEKYDFGTYITSELQLNDNLLIDGGLRYDFNRVDALKFYRVSRWTERGYDEDFAHFVVPPEDGQDFGSDLLANPVFNFHNISASIGSRYDFNDKNYILVNLSLSSRPPNPAELFSDGLHHSAARIELGDLRLNPEIAHRISTTYGYENTNFNLTAELFYNAINDYMYLRPTGVLQSNRGAFPVWEYEQTNAQLFGTDITLSYDFANRFNWHNKSSFIKGYDDDRQPLIDMPSFNTVNTIKYSNNEWHNFSASIQSEWVFEQNEFPDFNFELENPSTGEIALLDISTPPPGYHLFHFQSEATFALSNKTNLNIALGINNIFDTSYRNYLNRLRYFADDLGRNLTLQLKLNY
ncbi:TonB-dependent receptor [Psychroserpens algicola]|uniref:TonB-dependent receptor n=1 Tax=Psychroserpens algicola TaxID=1719034 RepID=A0ABT0H8I8_9FLAO|nr:TonB-dependent receptor [Psychroserpens algicola]MCK8480676.1 TonB-dependent receptor [Psychroserpens algicola]